MLARSALTTEWRPLAALGDIAEEWRDLAQRAAEPNVFYEPAFALAAAPVLGAQAGAVLVWSVNVPRRLLGLFPCVVQTRRYGIRFPLLAGWTHRYGPLGVPLVDRDAARPAIATFLDHIAEDAALPKLLLMPFLVADGPVAAALDAAVADRHGRQAAFGAHRRALLAPHDDRTRYLDAALGRKKRKELRRQRRRLADRGEVSFEMAMEPSDIAQALPAFFALEASGWKGAAGTAAANDSAIRWFMEGAVAGLAAEGKASVGRLVHHSRAIAAGVLLRSGAGAWLWKIAYDETVSRASPGVQITLDLTETLLREPSFRWCDSCATADHSMIDHVWRERRAIADRLIALKPGAGFALACSLEAVRRVAEHAAKRAIVIRR